MTDTVKMRRPKFPRQDGGPGGRVEHDSRGNALWVRSRATDESELPVDPALSIVDHPAHHTTVIPLQANRKPSKPRSR